MLKKLLMYLYFLLFFSTPLFMFGKTSELFEFNKIILIYFFAASIAAILFSYWLVYKTKPIKFSLYDVPILLFVISQIISTIFSIDMQTSLFGYYGRFNGGLYSIFAYVVLYYGFIFLLSLQHNPKTFLYRFFYVSLFSSFLTILWSIPGKFGHDLSCLLFVGEFNNSCWTVQFNPSVRMFSTLGQPNWFGAYLAIHFFIALFFFLKRSSDKKNITNELIFFVYLILNFCALLFTRSRSAIGSVGIGFVLFLFYYGFVSLRSKQKISKSLIALCISLVLCIFIFQTGIEKIDKYLSINTYVSLFSKTQQVPISKTSVTNTQNKDFIIGGVTDSLDIRKIVWKGAIDLGKEYFLFGTGVETFAYSYYFVRPKEHNLTSEWDYLYNKAHNEYLNYFATTGILGSFSYLLFIFLVLFVMLKAFRKIHNDQDLRLLFVILSLSYISILITNFFGFSTTTINLLFYVIPAVPVFYLLHFSPNSKIMEKNNSVSTINYAFIVIPYIFILIFLSNYWTSDIKYAMGDVYMKMNDYSAAATLFEQALENHYEHVYEDKLSNCYANLAFIASYQKEKDKALEYIQKAQEFNQRSLRASSSNIIYLKTTAKNDYLFYQITLKKEFIEEGLAALEKARILAPSDSKITYYLATYYSILYDEEEDSTRKKIFTQKALNSINESIMQKPNYLDSYILKVQLLKKSGRKAEAKDVIEFSLKQFDPKNEILLKELETL